MITPQQARTWLDKIEPTGTGFVETTRETLVALQKTQEISMRIVIEIRDHKTSRNIQTLKGDRPIPSVGDVIFATPKALTPNPLKITGRVIIFHEQETVVELLVRKIK